MKNQNRDNIGRYSKRGKLFRRFIWLVVMCAMVYGTYKYVILFNTKTTIQYQAVTVDNSIEMLAGKIDTLEKSVVEQVHICEANGYTESDGLVTFDPTNAQYAKVKDKQHFVNTGELSFGTYQYKQSTVIYYYKTLYSKVITGKEALIIALDDKEAGQLTQDILFKTDKGYTNWVNCSVTLKSMIDAIKKIN